MAGAAKIVLQTGVKVFLDRIFIYRYNFIDKKISIKKYL